MIEKITFFIADLIMPILVGYLLQRNNLLSRRFCDSMLTVALLAVYPLLSVLSFWVICIDMHLMWLPLFGLILHVIPAIPAFPVAERKFDRPVDRGSYLLSAILSNHLLVGGISAYLLYGETGFAYVQLAVLLQGIAVFMFCFPLAQHYKRCADGIAEQRGISLRAIFFNRNQIGLLGILAGIVLNQLAVERPSAGTALFDLLIHMNAWMSLIPVGHAIRLNEIRTHFRGIFSLSLIKFVFTPLVTAWLTALLLDDALMRNTLIILAFTPTAVNAVITVRLHNLNLPMVMAQFILTSLIYVLAVYPVLFLYLRQ